MLKHLKKNKSKKGFSLVEVLVSVIIVSILAILIVQTYISTMRNNTKTEVMKDLKQNGDYALSVISRMVQNAGSIAACTSNSLQIEDFEGNISTFDTQDSTTCRIASSSAAQTVYLTSSNIAVDGAVCADGVEFTCSNISGQPARVNVKFTLRQKNPAAANFEASSMQFQTNVVMRNLTY